MEVILKKSNADQVTITNSILSRGTKRTSRIGMYCELSPCLYVTITFHLLNLTYVFALFQGLRVDAIWAVTGEQLSEYIVKYNTGYSNAD